MAQAQAALAWEVRSLAPFYLKNNRGSRHARMDRLKSKEVTFGSEKTNEAYVDLGNTHLFLRIYTFLMPYEVKSPIFVSLSEGDFRLLGKGTICLPIGHSMMVQSYHAPVFTLIITAIHLVSEVTYLF